MLQANHLIKGTIELPNVIDRNIQTLLELVVSSISAPQEIVCPFLSDSCNESPVFFRVYNFGEKIAEGVNQEISLEK
ncbi:MAG: hypothetical protein ACK4M9_06050 [Anaerobacillus sp.]